MAASDTDEEAMQVLSSSDYRDPYTYHTWSTRRTDRGCLTSHGFRECADDTHYASIIHKPRLRSSDQPFRAYSLLLPQPWR